MNRSLAAILLLSLFSLAGALTGCSKKQQASPEAPGAGKSAGTPRRDGRLVLRPYRDLRELSGTVFEVIYTLLKPAPTCRS